MTILEMLISRHANNKLMARSLEIIKDNFTSLVNDNYELVINEKKELSIRIPSLEKRNEYVYKSIGDYKYPLIMCMRISDITRVDNYEYILGKFMELYKDKLELFFKDVNTVEKLMDKIKKTKNNIDYVTYVSIGAVVATLISLCIFTRMSQTTRVISIMAMIIFSAISLLGQISKENRVKKLIDGYISVIKTDWYAQSLTREYVYLCNYTG